MWFVYFLKSTRKNCYYVGSTNNLKRRFAEHVAGKVISTKFRLPLKLVLKISFPDERSARRYEQRIKKQRLLKERIIRNIDSHCRVV